MKKLLPFTMIVAPALTGCMPEAEIDDAEPLEIEMTLVASVERPSGNVFEIYLEEDGSVTMAEEGPTTSVPSLSPGELTAVHPLAVYRALTDAEPPPALAALRESVELAHLDPDQVVELTTVVNAPAAAAPKCSWQWFETKVCDKFLSDYDMDWCWGDEEEDSTQREDDQNQVFAMVCVDEGEVTFQKRTRRWWDWGSKSWTVEENRWRWWSKDATADFDFESKVRNAAGDLHQHGGYACSGTLSACPLILPDVVTD